MTLLRCGYFRFVLPVVFCSAMLKYLFMHCCSLLAVGYCLAALTTDAVFRPAAIVVGRETPMHYYSALLQCAVIMDCNNALVTRCWRLLRQVWQLCRRLNTASVVRAASGHGREV